MLNFNILLVAVAEQAGLTPEDIFSRKPDRDVRGFCPCEIIYLTYSYQPMGKIKKLTAARWPHLDP